MTMIFPALMFLILVAVVATTYTEGMWSNALRLVNVVFAALLATNYWEPVARFAEQQAPTFTFFIDFLVLWGLFGLFMIIFRVLTDFLSRVNVRFLKIADRIGSGFFAVWTGWVIVCFTMFSLNTAPLAKTFLFGGFQPGQSNFLAMAPDLQWVVFVQRMSRGPFSRGLSEAEVADGHYGVGQSDRDTQTAVFDRNADFVYKYTARRGAVENYINEKGTPRAAEGDVPKR